MERDADSRREVTVPNVRATGGGRSWFVGRTWSSDVVDIPLAFALAYVVCRAILSTTAPNWWLLGFVIVFNGRRIRHRPRWCYRLSFIFVVGVGAAMLLANARR